MGDGVTPVDELTVAAAAAADTFQANLSALRSRRPELGRRLAAVAVPQNATLARGRDGAMTYRIDGADGASRWLGRTSTPRVRAEALCEPYGANSGNVLVPGMGNGMEMLLLLRRLSAHSAVFVHEPDLVAARLALSLHDFSAEILSGRLVILAESDAAAAIERFFESAPEYEFPQKLMALPYMAATEVSGLRESMERASARVGRMQSDEVRRCGALLAERSASRRALERVVVSTIDPRASSVETAAALGEAARAAGWGVGISIPDRADRCHSLARIRAVAEAPADAAILVNCGWGALLPHIPETFCAATWLLPDARLIAGMTDGFGARHVVFAATEEQRRSAMEAGAAPDRVAILEPGVDGEVFRPSERTSADRFDAALLGDVADLRAESLGITLASQVCVWQRVSVECARRLYGSADEVLEAAERSSGVTLGDEPVRRQFLSLIDRRVMPTMVQRAAAQCLLEAGVDVRVFGNGWQFSRLPASRVFPSPAGPRERNEVYQAARVVVCPLSDARSVQTCLEACHCGGCAVRYQPVERAGDAHPQLADALDAVPSYATLEAMVVLVREACAPRPQTADATRRCRRAGQIIADRHLVGHRLATMRDALAGLLGTS